MGTSFVEYKERGFWSWDGYLEHTLFSLAEAIGPSPEDSWLHEAREHWREQASGFFTAFIHPNLDKFVTTEQRRNVVLGLIQEVISRPNVTPEVVETAGLLRSLLLGELTTDTASPLDYMVNGKHPYEWSASRDSEMKK